MRRSGGALRIPELRTTRGFPHPRPLPRSRRLVEAFVGLGEASGAAAAQVSCRAHQMSPLGTLSREG